jgi:hypothetical protein
MTTLFSFIYKPPQKETRDNEAQSSKGNRIEDCQP